MRYEAARGVRDVLPIVLGAVPFGVLFGALAAQASFGLLNTLLMSLLVYSGTMQMIGLNMIVTGTSWPMIAFASLVVNSRHVFYSAALVPHMRELSLWWRLALSYGMTDQIYLLAERRYAAKESDTKHWYVLSTSVVLLLAWFAATWAGFEFGDVLKDFSRLGLDFALYATYIALAAPLFGDVRAVLAGIAAGLCALALVNVPYQGGLFIAILAGVATGLLCERFAPQHVCRGSDRPHR